MSTISSLVSTSDGSGTSAGQYDRFQELGTESFLKMMIAELQSQDPLNPMDNSKMLEQINQIRSISASDGLTKSIESLQLGQSMSTAAGLLGKNITGLDVIGNEVTGKVDKVVFEDGTPKLFVGNTIVELGNVYGMSE
ncbi:MAG: flagellar hook capping protein [Planctomycetaceae bacterium]|nr:flagellar hook capping protein [Planctomycetaceae bacterium]